MKISDEMLSAFLDLQLPQDEQTSINAQLFTDETLQRRVALLYAQHMALKLLVSEVDQASNTDDSLLNSLLTAQPQHRFKNVGTGLLSLAASITFLAGITLGFFGLQKTAPNEQAVWQITQHYLAEKPSGRYALEQSTLSLQFSFKDNLQSYCRVYDIEQDNWLSSHIACKHGKDWQQVFTTGRALNSDSHYQAATGQNPLDPLINQLMQGEPLTELEELQNISDGWLP